MHNNDLYITNTTKDSDSAIGVLNEPIPVSFLECLQLDELRELYLQGQIFFILSIKFDRIIWTDRRSLSFLGYETLFEALNAPTNFDLNTQCQLGFGLQTGQIVQLDGRFDFNNFVIKTITLPNGEPAVLVECVFEQFYKRNLNNIIKGISDPKIEAAIYTSYGEVLEQSSPFSLFQKRIRKDIQSFLNGSLIASERVQDGEDSQIIAYFSLSDMPKLYLVLILDPFYAKKIIGIGQTLEERESSKASLTPLPKIFWRKGDGLFIANSAITPDAAHNFFKETSSFVEKSFIKNKGSQDLFKKAALTSENVQNYEKGLLSQQAIAEQNLLNIQEREAFAQIGETLGIGEDFSPSEKYIMSEKFETDQQYDTQRQEEKAFHKKKPLNFSQKIKAQEKETVPKDDPFQGRLKQAFEEEMFKIEEKKTDSFSKDFDLSFSKFIFQDHNKDSLRGHEFNAQTQEEYNRKKPVIEAGGEIANSYGLEDTAGDTYTFEHYTKDDVNLLLDKAFEGVFFLDKLGFIKALSDRAALYLGYPKNFFIGKNFSHFFENFPRDFFFDKVEDFQQNFQKDDVIVSFLSKQEQEVKLKFINLTSDRGFVVLVSANKEKRQEISFDKETIKIQNEDIASVRGNIAQEDLSSKPFEHKLSYAQQSLKQILKFHKDVILKDSAFIGDEYLIKHIYNFINSGEELMSFLDGYKDGRQHDSAVFSKGQKESIAEKEYPSLAISQSDLFYEVLYLLENEANKNGVIIRSMIACELGNVIIESSKLKQILLSLLANAIQFTPSGGRVSLSVQNQKTDNKVCIRIEDTGTGMSPLVMQRALEGTEKEHKIKDFFTKKTFEKTLNCSILNLASAKRLIENNGGKFFIHSKPNQGTTISILLPVYD